MRKEEKKEKGPRVSKVFKFVEGWVEIAGVENSGLCVLEGGFVGCWVSVRIGSC